MSEFRIGQGIDIHPFCVGRRLVLGGVEIPCDRGLAGHSDADVLLHAVADALLRATGRGDIGTYFPDTDSQWKDVDSRHLLQRVYEEIHSDGWSVVNVDCTVLAQIPRLAPYVAAMKQEIGKVLDLLVDAIAIKATTTEHLGCIGREEGIAAFAVCMLRRG